MKSFKLKINPKVREALTRLQPVVALESTIIAHGMPFPQNVTTALEVEQIIRNHGAVPATIGIINGELIVGLTEDEINFLAQSQNVIKVSRRDLPFVIARRQHGATTVAATMIIAALAGIKVFVTGGIGGVHRGAGDSFDVSADLQELAQTDVAVISAGVKSILDIASTLEYLETYGVPVVTYGSPDFPAFYTSKSGVCSPYQIDDVKEIAQVLQIKWDLGLRGGMVIANPVPSTHQMPPQAINEAIAVALQQADALDIRGKAIPPYLLDAIKDLTAGKSLEANIQLVYNNAKLGARIAVELSALNQQQ